MACLRAPDNALAAEHFAPIPSRASWRCSVACLQIASRIFSTDLPATLTLPTVPRALPVTSSVSLVSDPQIGQWQPVRLLDGTTVQVCYQGELPSSAALPHQGRFIGEEWSTGNTSWIWMTPAGASFPSRIDP